MALHTSQFSIFARRTHLFLNIVGALIVVLHAPNAGFAAEGGEYTPGYSDDWEVRAPETLGLNARKLDAAQAYQERYAAAAPDEPRELDKRIIFGLARGNEPYIELLGPTKDRGDPNGIVIHKGYIVAEWGPTERVDMVFSMTKTFISLAAGLAQDRYLIRGIDDPVRDYVKTAHFEGPHNAKISWNHLLRQTSDWEGELWGVPDWADRPGSDLWAELNRKREKPGSRYEYNDVRVNLAAYALLELWRRPLPQVLREYLMDPIDASPTWRWHGYDNSWVLIDGQKMQSVSGGGHWGGGMWMSSRDIARVGLLFLRGGEWNGREVISKEWLDQALTPGKFTKNYGYMNFRPNTDKKLLRTAPEDAFIFSGGGATNICYVDRENDLVVVLRWTAQGPSLDELYVHVDQTLKRVRESLQ